ncbi:hypothetical protein LZ32DRAFT_627547 [Colletotrichum eremochloae]|nr:hypothetical protein LZ32DRAFT_627547 [Colletotrichum eremochloae]
MASSHSPIHRPVLTRPTDIEAAFKRVQRLRKQYEALEREVELHFEPNEERSETTPEARLQLAKLGIGLAVQEKQVIRAAQRLAIHLMHRGNLAPDKAMKYIHEQNKCYFSAGGDLWRHKKKKALYEGSGAVPVLAPGNYALIHRPSTCTPRHPTLVPRSHAMMESILPLYTRSDGLSWPSRRPLAFRKDAMDCYNGHAGNGTAWCHVSGMWYIDEDIEAANIVPFFADIDSIPALLFGDRAESIERAGNALLLSEHIKGWYDRSYILIVPVDARETPITRWKTDVVCPHIKNLLYTAGHCGRDLDGKELKFLNDKRPVPRFLYFRFIITLLRMKRLDCNGWREVWAKYHTHRPFPTPGRYMRESVLLALVSHFGAPDTYLVNSWIRGHGFDAPLTLTDDEAVEVARRVHMAVEYTAYEAEKWDQDEGNESEDDEE